MYLDSIGIKMKQEIVSPEHSPSFNYSLTSSKNKMPTFENKVIKLESFSGSSGDENASLMPESFKRKNKSSQQIMINQFSSLDSNKKEKKPLYAVENFSKRIPKKSATSTTNHIENER